MSVYLITIYSFFIAISISTGFWMIKKYQRSPSVIYLSGVLLGLAIMMTAQVVLFSTKDLSTALLFDRLGFFGGVWTFSMILMFSLFFPFPTKRLPHNNALLWILPNVFFLPYIFLNPSFLKSVDFVAAGVHENYGMSFWLFPLVIGAFFISSVVVLLKKVPLAQGVTQSSIRLFVLTLFVTTGLAIFFDVVRPAFGYPRIPISGLYALLLFSVSTYVLARK